MDRKTALSTAGALTMTCVAAVSALFITMGAGSGTSNQASSAEPQVVTDYEIVYLDPAATLPTAGTDQAVADDTRFVDPAPAPTAAYDDDHDDEHDDEHHHESGERDDD